MSDFAKIISTGEEAMSQPIETQGGHGRYSSTKPFRVSLKRLLAVFLAARLEANESLIDKVFSNWGQFTMAREAGPLTIFSHKYEGRGGKIYDRQHYCAAMLR